MGHFLSKHSLVLVDRDLERIREEKERKVEKRTICVSECSDDSGVNWGLTGGYMFEQVRDFQWT